jgi:hypothetical protein
MERNAHWADLGAGALLARGSLLAGELVSRTRATVARSCAVGVPRDGPDSTAWAAPKSAIDAAANATNERGTLTKKAERRDVARSPLCGSPPVTLALEDDRSAAGRASALCTICESAPSDRPRARA